jgi:hypothetical protein
MRPFEFKKDDALAHPVRILSHVESDGLAKLQANCSFFAESIGLAKDGFLFESGRPHILRGRFGNGAAGGNQRFAGRCSSHLASGTPPLSGKACQPKVLQKKKGA